jgi:hypothetical protein
MAEGGVGAVHGAPPALARASLLRVVQTRETHKGDLSRTVGLSRRLAAIEAKIRAAGGDVGGTRAGRRFGTRRRAQIKVSLADALRSMLKGKALGMAEAADAVLKSGFKATSKNFRTMVAIQLGNAKGINRFSGGKYTAK